MAKTRHSSRYFAEYLAFRLIISVVAALPLRTALSCCTKLGLVFAKGLPQKMVRGHVARENLKRSFPTHSDSEIERLVHGMWTHLFRLLVEIIHMPRKISLETMPDVFEFRNRDETVRALCSGRPVIILGGHFGNWEIGNIAFGIFGFPVNAVARDLDNPYLHRWFLKIRQKSGGRLISKRGGSSEMTEVLENRGLLGLLCDQDAGGRGLFVPFFGRDASTFKSIALLAMEYRALIAVGYSLRLEDELSPHARVRYEVGVEAILDPEKYDANAVNDITVDYTAALERIVRRAPEQYFWVHRRWKSVPQPRGRKSRHAA